MKQATKVRAKNGQSGAVAVEFALVLPFLALLLAGALDVGLMTMDHQILQNAARDGARYASLPGNNINDVVGGPAALTRIRTRVQNYLSFEGITVAPGDITVQQGAGQCDVTFGDGTAVRCVQVRIIYAKSLFMPGMNLVGANPVNLEGNAVFRNLFE